MPIVDTRSCIADFRTNSFVGTEGTFQIHVNDFGCHHSLLIARLPLDRVHRTRGDQGDWAYVSCRLVDTRDLGVRDDREFYLRFLYRLPAANRTLVYISSQRRRSRDQIGTGRLPTCSSTTCSFQKRLPYRSEHVVTCLLPLSRLNGIFIRLRVPVTASLQSASCCARKRSAVLAPSLARPRSSSTSGSCRSIGDCYGTNGHR
jgi:hypothetical protein